VSPAKSKKEMKMDSGNIGTLSSYPFIKPWTPQKQVYVESLKRWQPGDSCELSIQRDLAATLGLCEVLGMNAHADAEELQRNFVELAGLGYAGYCYLDFPSVSYRRLLEAYGHLAKQCSSDSSFEPVTIWNWLDELLDSACTERKPSARILFKNPSEPIYRTAADPEEETMFARLKAQDSSLGHEADDTQAHFVGMLADEFGQYHSLHKVMALGSRDVLIAASMDLVDQLSNRHMYQSLPRRIQYARAYRDVAIGRVFPSNQVGRIWFLYDNAVGLDYDIGYDDLRIGVAIGAERK
jgi:hypothetical protein